MATARVTINDQPFQRRLSSLEHGLEDAAPLMRIWGEIARTSIDENFERGGRPPWTPLAPATIARRIGARKTLRRMSRAGKLNVSHLRPLIVTGTLRSITVKPEQQRVVIGSAPAAKAYAAIHQYGGMAGRGHTTRIPARPYIMLQSEDMEEMKDELERYVIRLAKS